MKTKAIIIGGGIAGTSLALFLKRLNIDSEIYEAYGKRTDVGGGFQIAPNGMKVMAELGLADMVLKKGVISSDLCFQNEKGNVLADVKHDGLVKYGIPAVNIARSSFHEILVDEVVKQNIVIHYKKRLKMIMEKKAGVVAAFEDGTEAHGSFLIGADGVHSKAREYVSDSGIKPVYTGLLNVGGFAPAAALGTHLPSSESPTFMTFGRKGFFGYCLCNKAPGEEVMWWSNIPIEKELTNQQLQSIGTEQIRDELLVLHKEWHSPIEDIIKMSPSIFKSNIHDIENLTSWTKNRVLLIGDAAHAMSPHAGQGASVSLEDSMYLAKLIKDSEGSIESIFTRFEKDRKKRADKIIQVARRNGSGKKELSPVGSWFRDRFLSLLLPVFAGKGQDWIHGYEINWKNKE